MFSQPPDCDGESVPPREALNHPVCRAKKTRPRQKVPLAALLVEQGCFACLDEARRSIMAGKVLVNNHRLDKPGMLVPRDAIIRIRGSSRYASRAGYKLEAALDHFAVDVVGQVALDCGASTGGFTDCLLQHGAAQVYAVDVGHGQLIGRLRLDSRVRNLERINLSHVTLTMLTPPPSLITLDLSYLSLTTGHIDDPMLLVTALQQVIDAGTACGLAVQGVAKLALQPRHGVHEFFVSFVRSPDALSCSYDAKTLLALIEERGIGRSEEE
jgi:23S rRNA (cytidine1920-2'-O)/16S rRNA (cytidine1409-2'-O)-methyltransferase